MTNARLRKAQRSQVEMRCAALDEMLPEDHWVRLVWKHVDRLDLRRFTDSVRAVQGGPGRDATDPKILVAVWVVALAEGIGSARRIAELATRDLVYQWVLGGVTVNRDMLATFRSKREKELDELLTQSIAVLMKAEIVTLNAVAQDGMKVRASAGAGSFRRETTLREHLEQAREQVQRLKTDLHEDGSSATTRQNAARQRAADEKLDRADKAMAELPKVIAAKEAQANKTRAKKSAPRVSTTDPDARVMKMADGGFRPAYNPQFASDVGSGVIVGVQVTNDRTDVHQMESMLSDVLSRTGYLPIQYLVDGGYVCDSNIEGLDGLSVELLAPVREPLKRKYDPYTRQPRESAPLGDWRERMGTERGKEQYKDRASTAERTNAELRETGLRSLSVRGMSKVTSAVLLSALAYNIGRMVALMA